MLFGTLVASVLRNILAEEIREEEIKEEIAAGNGFCHSWVVFLMWSQPLTKFEIQKYYQSEPKFEGVCSWNIL